MYSDGPRTWKYAVPFGFLILLIPVTGWMMTSTNQDVQYLAIVPIGFCVLLGGMGLVNLWAWIAHQWSSTVSDMEATKNLTPEVRMFEAARSMHPDAVKALLMHRRTIWRVKYVPMKDTVDWILDEAPSVHAGFVDFVLDHSSNVSLMPKRFLSDGSKQFDPEGLMTDYQQYDDLVVLMQSKLMLTQGYGSQAPQFLPPWTLETIRRRFGLDGETYGGDEEMSEALKTVIRAQAATEQKTNGNHKVPEVIQQALTGLEQTNQMKVNSENAYKQKGN